MLRLPRAFIAVVTAVACADAPTAWRPDPRINIQPPVIQSIAVAGSLRPGETIIFSALAKDTLFRMPAMSRYPMFVSTNRGEVEPTFANSEACLDSEDRIYVCQSFRVYFDGSTDPEALRRAAHDAKAYIVRIDWWPDSASYYAFGDLDDAMRAIRRRPGVTRVLPWYLDSIGIGHDTFHRYASAFFRYEEGTPTPNDGKFTANASDSIFVSVRRPDGAMDTRIFTGWRF